MSFGRGKYPELYSEKITQTGLTGLLGASSEAVAKSCIGLGCAEDTELPHAPLQGREQKLLAIFGKTIDHQVENKRETRIKTLTKMKNKACVRRMSRSHCEAYRGNNFS